MASILKPFGNLLSPGPFQVPLGSLVIDWTNPLTNGLISAFVPGAMGGADICGALPTLTASVGNTFDGITQEGPGLRSVFNASGIGINATIANNYPAYTAAGTGKAQTMYWRGYIATPAFNATYIGIQYANPNSSPFVFFTIGGDSSGNNQLSWNNGGSLAHLAGPTAATGFFSFAGVLIQGSGGTPGSITIYSAGSQFATVAVTLNFGTSGQPTTYFTIGQTNTTQGSIVANAAYAWNRALSAGEIALLDQYPYDFLIPAEAEMSLLPAPPPQFLIQTRYSQGINFTD